MIVSVWADRDRLLLAAYRYRKGGNPVTLTLRRDLLVRYGLRRVPVLEMRVLNAEALEKPAHNFHAAVSREAVTLTGDLAEGEMLLLEGRNLP